jgi:hypothetical protein
LSDLFGGIIVAVCLGGRFSSFDGFMTISHKLRNLKVAATKSLNLDSKNFNIV